ncbi:MAG: putative signal peptide protein, partial [Bacteroidota bacterium]
FKDLKDIGNNDMIFLTSDSYLNLPGVSDAVKDYIDYRQSPVGGGYKIYLLNVEEIYDQFGYGIDKHLHSFKNFNYYLNQIPNKLKYIYIVGKGREYRLWREPNNDISTLFVPSYGDFPSDEYLFTDPGKNLSKYAVGRISSINAEELNDYLNKVKEYEAELTNVKNIDDLYWRKRVIHLAGGGNAGEQLSIKSFFSTMDATIKSSTLGGETQLFSKTTTDPIGAITSQNILKLINSGVSIISFFGHSGVGSWDISIENPSRWDNKGKYPIILSLGCLAGNIHTQYQGIGEDFVFTKDKGGIAFIASSGKAELFPQGVMGNSFYEIFGTSKYGSTLGLMLRDLKEKHSTTGFISFNSIIQQLTLLGDPALKIYEAPSPDYTPYASSLKTSPEIISSSDETFDLTIDIYNLGKTTTDSMNVRILFKNFTRNIVDTIVYRIKSPITFEKVTFTIPNKGINSLGRNTIFLTLDPDNVIEERPTPRAELNNELVFDDGTQGYEFYILDNTAIPVYPSEFGIVNILPELKAATSNAFAEEAKYIIQVDTTNLFNSPFLHTGVVVSKGGTFSYKPDITMKQAQVYYWRVSPDSTDSNGFTWLNSSFIFLKEYEDGWNQSHFFQYKRNPLNLISINENRNFVFSPRLRNTEVVNGKYVRDLIGFRVDFGKFAGSIRPWDFLDGGITIAIADPNTGLYRKNNSGDFGSIATTAFGGQFCYAFNTKTKEQRKSIIDFVNNQIPDGHYVVFFTTYSSSNADLKADEWEADSIEFGENIFSVMEKRGATEIRKLKKDKILPYTYMYRQNFGYIDEDIGSDLNDIINSKTQFLYSGVNGVYESLPIGPVLQWDKVIWDSKNEINDTSRVSVIGIKKDNTSVVLFENVIENSIDISSVDAQVYPYIKLVYYASDYVNRTVPYLNYWRVVAKPLPDGEINPKLAFSVPDSVQQGEKINIKIGLANYTKPDMDSILVKFTISNEANENTIVSERLIPLTSKKEIVYSNTIDSRNLKGNYVFNFEMNPNEDQPELYKFNNIGIKKFKVYPDKINPILDVYIDGIKIMDGDVITSNPIIKVVLKDENKFLLLDNPENFIISLIYPDKKKKDFSINDPEVKFNRASDANDNEASFELNLNLIDGDYTLIANAKDATGNASGDNKYEVDFVVAGKQAITDVVNYPNPFSKSTRFVFNVTGKVPEKMLIQIMTLSGKVVKEITKEELGPIKLGSNITDYAWDGTDEYGSKLANGVYLYKVIARDQNSELIEKIGTELDSYFKSGVGKLVIIR